MSVNSEEDEFRESINKAHGEALKELNGEQGERCDVFAEVNEKSEFARKMREFGSHESNKHTIHGVSLTDSSTLVLQGIPSYGVKDEIVSAYNKFENTMNENGYNTYISITVKNDNSSENY